MWNLPQEACSPRPAHHAGGPRRSVAGPRGAGRTVAGSRVRRWRRAALAAGLCLPLAAASGCIHYTPNEVPGAKDDVAGGIEPGAPPGAVPIRFSPGQEIALFDGERLGWWRPRDHGAGDRVAVRDGAIHLGWGSSGAGVVWSGPSLRSGYELKLDLQRLEGSAGGYSLLTFPVGRESCTLSFGDQITTRCPAEDPRAPRKPVFTRSVLAALDSERPHAVRVRVSSDRLEIEVDESPVAETALPLVAEPGTERASVLEPLAITAWATSASVSDIRIRPLGD